MRIKILLPISFVLAFGMGSCKKNLEEKPFSSLSPASAFANETALKETTLGVYQSWTSTPFFDVFDRFILAECGHRYATAGIYDDAFFYPYYNFAESPTDDAAASVWGRYYITIARANSVIANAVKAVPDTTIASIYIAEARFNRAYAYFNLVRDFGGVPLVNVEITSLAQSDAIYAPNASVQETYDFIVEDLQFAESHLPATWSGDDLGRISAGAAKALLGKVYLTMAGLPLNNVPCFQKAVDKLNEVVGPAGEAMYNFGLLPNFSDIFSISNKRNKEVVFSFSYFYSSASPDGSLYPFFLFPVGLVDGDEQTRFGYTPEFYNLFENNDTRRDFTVVNRYMFTGNANIGAVAGDSIIYDATTHHYIIQRTGEIFGNSNIFTGMAYGKLARVARPPGSIPWGYSTDLIELRYADVLLCLAEALNETGKTSDALILLNRVRARAQASAYSLGSQDQLRDEIRNERRLELTGEFTTVYDIRRWGTLQSEIAAMTPLQIINNALNPYSPKLELYPIPQTQLDANPNLIQNPGW
jgi:hypothetical protein